jgi:hypothetical protein
VKSAAILHLSDEPDGSRGLGCVCNSGKTPAAVREIRTPARGSAWPGPFCLNYERMTRIGHYGQ